MDTQQQAPGSWLPRDAPTHTRMADTPFLCCIWCNVANAIFAVTMDRDRAIRSANSAVVAERRRPATRERAG